ncbi:hypothetical protein [Craterilacuibacter sp. RT1T]|uniref:hypothetical protein n=1 Tax=Craterilacuibacter sp. RT1T TaxID=2942211 RepID=UPI0020BF4D42|nr:hypothetical protein [Craterilacuibacter sp. RT1T]MCL6263163.1 hypothetical protein [Craterilacuibacter sp. RT1T]
MKVILAGVAHRKGISKKNGNPFDMKQAVILQQIENAASANYCCQAFGLEGVTLPVLDDVDLTQFSGIRFPVTCDLELTTQFRGSTTISKVVGFSNIKPLVA